MSPQCGQNVLHIACIRSRKVASFYTRVSRSWTCSTFGYTCIESSTWRQSGLGIASWAKCTLCMRQWVTADSTTAQTSADQWMLLAPSGGPPTCVASIACTEMRRHSIHTAHNEHWIHRCSRCWRRRQQQHALTKQRRQQATTGANNHALSSLHSAAN